jgi:hypothetical protein
MYLLEDLDRRVKQRRDEQAKVEAGRGDRGDVKQMPGCKADIADGFRW